VQPTTSSPLLSHGLRPQRTLRCLAHPNSRAVLTNRHTGHVPRAPGFFFLFEGPPAGCDEIDFYREMLSIRGTSHGPVSVCLSVTSGSFLLKTAKRRITQTTPHDSPGTLVFRSQRSPRNSTGVTPYGGAKS